MRWKWDEMTSPEFARAVAETKGVCVVPCGVIEKHGDHLPLGTDFIAVGSLAERAAEIEPAVIFPALYFGQIAEAKHCPGTVSIRMKLFLELLENVCDEIARNGLKKIIILNGHGGNEFLLGHFSRTMLERERDYVVYLVRLGDYFGAETELKKEIMETEFDEHGGEVETSVMMALEPQLVKLDEVDPESGKRLRRLAHLPRTRTTVQWYSDFPDHYAGDARPASPEKGERFIEVRARAVAEIVKSVKEDGEAGRLQAEFYSRTRH